MARKEETKVVYYCDVCGRESNLPLEECSLCGKEACYTCSNQLYDVYNTHTCKHCLGDETIDAHFRSIHKHWLVERRGAIEALKAVFESSKPAQEE